jgi:integrase
MNDGLVSTNPFSGLRLEGSRGRKDLEALTEEQIIALADCAKAVHGSYGAVVRAMILVLGFAGIRPGEAFALEWGDISGDEMTVSRALDSTGRVKLPKNGKPRTILIPPLPRAALAEVPRLINAPWVFTTKTGRRFNKGHLARYFEPVRAAFGRPRLQPYELRHACATMLMDRGVDPADIAQQLGHSDHGRLVQELYGHPSDRRARERVRRAFGANVMSLKSVKEQGADG